MYKRIVKSAMLYEVETQTINNNIRRDYYQQRWQRAARETYYIMEVENIVVEVIEYKSLM